MKKMWWGVLAGALLGTMSLAQDVDLMSKMINKDTNGSWYFQPEKPKAKHYAVPELPGGYAFRVKAHKGVESLGCAGQFARGRRHQ